MKLHAFKVTAKLANNHTQEFYLFATAKDENAAYTKMEALLYNRIRLAKKGDEMFRKCPQHYHQWHSFFIETIQNNPHEHISYLSRGPK